MTPPHDQPWKTLWYIGGIVAFNIAAATLFGIVYLVGRAVFVLWGGAS